MLSKTSVLMTVPKRRTSFRTSEEPEEESGTFLITNRLFQLTRDGHSWRKHIDRTFTVMHEEQQFLKMKVSIRGKLTDGSAADMKRL